MDKPHIYKITNQINDKFYYGVHNGSNTEKYMGSGKALHQAYEKYGIENFSKEILMWFDTIEEAYEYEAIVVTEKLVNDPNCYNLRLGGKGGWEHIDVQGENNPFFGKTHSEETRQKLSENAKKRTGEKSPMWGKTHSEETKQKLRKPKSEEHKQKLSNSIKGEKHIMWGKTHSEETKQKMSENSKGKNKKENFPINICPYCKKTSNMSPGFKRWHFNNCKYNQINNHKE